MAVKERYVTDEHGNRTAVLLDVERYRELLEAQEELESIRAFDEAKASGDEAVSLADYKRVRDAVAALADDPRPAGCKKLVGREGWRIRVGAYRVIYEVDGANQAVTVLHAGHRRDVY